MCGHRTGVVTLQLAAGYRGQDSSFLVDYLRFPQLDWSQSWSGMHVEEHVLGLGAVVKCEGGEQQVLSPTAF